VPDKPNNRFCSYPEAEKNKLLPLAAVEASLYAGTRASTFAAGNVNVKMWR